MGLSTDRCGSARDKLAQFFNRNMLLKSGDEAAFSLWNLPSKKAKVKEYPLSFLN